MPDILKQDARAVQAAVKILLDVLPRNAKAIHNISYTCGLIFREAGITVEQATDVLIAWSERLRALPNFKTLYPQYKKPSLYRYQIRYSVSSAYKRPQDKPSSSRFRTLTGKTPPPASFWDKADFSEGQVSRDKKPEKKTAKPKAGSSKTIPVIKPVEAREEKRPAEKILMSDNTDFFDGGPYIGPITVLLEKLGKLEKAGPADVDPVNTENGYSRSICLLAAACLESYVMRVRFLNRDGLAGGGSLPAADLLARLYPDFPFRDELSGALMLRDKIAGCQSSVTASRRKNKPDGSLSDIDPASVGAADALRALQTVWNTLTFLENKDDSQCKVSHIKVKHKSRMTKFGKVIGLS
ncbi:MAG: hypothetical protein HZB33_12055 [Nitrospirae bacterium]|nr:hypothetical protein [Nitrospirota bacterium]